MQVLEIISYYCSWMSASDTVSEKVHDDQFYPQLTTDFAYFQKLQELNLQPLQTCDVVNDQCYATCVRVVMVNWQEFSMQEWVA